MTRCAIKGCRNIKPQRKSGKVCSIHFLPTAYKEQTWYQKNFSSVYKPRLNDGAIPTENLDLDVLTDNDSALGEMSEIENIEHEDFTALEQQDINEKVGSTTSKNQNSKPAK
ncbi:unnamed protein product [Lasius platythorax]|uniref:THAP-type domain-containing protein n=1 Tax=Lasius platythorax TaxID=488582 RepID=A0AAV2NHD4_9HYME